MIASVGEVRQVGIEVTSQLNQSFVIDAASFLITKVDGTIIESGIATIDTHKILTLFSVTNAGQYYCEFTYHIASEILKAKIYIAVK